MTRRVRVLRKSILLISLVFLFESCAHRVIVQSVVDPKKYNRIAVLPFQSNSVLSNAGGELADEIVVNLLQNAHDLEIIERTKIEEVLREQNLASSGLLDPNTTILLHKLLGVNAILTGNLSTSIGDTASPLTFAYATGATVTGTIQQEYLTRIAKGIATVRLIDTETGKVVWAKRLDDSSSTNTFLSHGQIPISATMTDGELIEEVVKNLSYNIARNFWEHEEYKW